MCGLSFLSFDAFPFELTFVAADLFDKVSSSCVTRFPKLLLTLRGACSNLCVLSLELTFDRDLKCPRGLVVFGALHTVEVYLTGILTTFLDSARLSVATCFLSPSLYLWARENDA